MDDFNVTSLHESKNEWGARLLTILTPLIVEGFNSIYNEALTLCKENSEQDKHLMTFQNFLSRIPKWNASIIENEYKRITDKSSCAYLEDLVTCVHVIQLKLLTAVRVGSKQKKIDVKIPKIQDFIHKVYIISARKIYKNVYLYERAIPPLQIQKNNRELEILIQESILNAVRESIPVDVLLRSYLDETYEDDVQVEIHEEVLDAPIEAEDIRGGDMGEKRVLSFDNIDSAISTDKREEKIAAPKDIATLEEIGNMRHEARKMEEEDDDEPSGRLIIGDDNVTLDHTDVHDLEPASVNVMPDLLIDDIEILE